MQKSFINSLAFHINMKKRDYILLSLIMLIAIFAVVGNMPILSANDDDTTKGNASDDDTTMGNNSEDDTEKICCNIFGYGANMKKVSGSYELMEKGECAVEKNFVGGGREVVNEKRCEAGYTNRVMEAVQERNRLRLNQSEVPENCTKTGSVLRCELESGKAMVIMAGESGNTIIKFDGNEDNISTKAELYHHNGEIYGIFGEETKLIEYLPEQLRERIRERTRARLNNTSITLNENGEYEYEAEKESRFLGLFKVKEKMHWKIDSETGEILNENAPWWGFLASDVEE